MPPVKITVVGTGYVGVSNAVLLAQRNAVVALDIDTRKVEQLNAKTSPIADPEKPLEVLRTIHSFDPCLACAVHLYDPHGKTLNRVTIG